MSDTETQPIPVPEPQPEGHEPGVFTADTDQKVKVGPITQAAFDYAQQLINLFDAHQNDEFERQREFLMVQLVEFAQEFVAMTHKAESSGILNKPEASE